MISDTLITKAQEGDKEAIEKILINFKYYGYFLRKFFIFGMEKDDIFQEIRIALYNAIMSYKGEKSSFNTFANVCINSRLASLIISARTNKRMVLTRAIENSNFLSNLEIEEKLVFNDCPEKICMRMEEMKKFKIFFNEYFSNREKEVFKLLILGYSQPEISSILKIEIKSCYNTVQRLRNKINIYLSDLKRGNRI